MSCTKPKSFIVLYNGKFIRVYKETAADRAIDNLESENRKLKRALWLARAEMAKWKSLYYWYAISNKYKSRKFDEVERKCLAKAEEYNGNH